MSLSHSLTAAYSGLTASAKAASIVAENMANLRTPGYGRREVLLSSSALGGGVMITGIQRHQSPIILAERRVAQAQTAGAEVQGGFLKSLEGWLGLPGTAGSLDSRINGFDSALIAAAADPGSEARLTNVLGAAQSLATQLRGISGQIQHARSAADRSIATDVGLLNDSLAQIEALNRDILRLTSLRQDPSGLIDQRQAVVDRIAEVVPLREVARPGGQIALYSTGGAVLIDGRASVFGFEPAGQIVPGSTGLSGLTLNGRTVGTGPGELMRGGRLEASFALRDEVAPKAQIRLDALARDMMTRLEGVDRTVPHGAAGLFTDAGTAFDPAREQGLAARIVVNAAADPGQGGALWRLRAGLGASAPGDSGANGLLTALSSALSEPRSTASGGYLPGQRSLAGVGSELVSAVATSRLSAEAGASQSAARQVALEQLEAEGGVDTDQETQLLLTIERTYAANARVIQAIEQMLDRLLEI
jgi:flagellar hook-associated protein 1